MAVLSRPPAGHVRAAGEAIAIVDLDDAGTGVPRGRRGRRRADRVTAALIGGALGLAVSLWPAAPSRPVPAAASGAPVAASSAADLAVLGTTDKTLALPAGVTGVDLAAIPDRLLNDPPAARLRLAVPIRGTFGIASVDAPSEIAWTEAGYWYWMRSKDLTITQLIDLAGALR